VLFVIFSDEMTEMAVVPISVKCFCPSPKIVLVVVKVNTRECVCPLVTQVTLRWSVRAATHEA
jgi:hypothetical protein